LTHTFQGKEFQDGFGYDFLTRTYDPYTMRMLQVDGANQFASGYVGMGNNPVSMINPDGQVAFVPILVGAALSVFVNSTINYFVGNDMFKGTVGAAIGGAMTAGLGSAISGQLATKSVWAAAGFGLSFTPDLDVSSTGFQIGVNVGFGYSNKFTRAGVNLGVGYTYQKLLDNSISGFTAQFGAGVSVGAMNVGGKAGNDASIGLYTSIFRGAGASQQVAGFGLNVPPWKLGGLKIPSISLGYENDFAPFEKLGGLQKLLNDEGDRFRTAAGFLKIGKFDARLNMFTGEHSYFDYSDEKNYPRGLKAGGSADKYRFGAITLGFKGSRIGWNSESIRDLFQNRFAHEIVSPQEYFKRMPNGYPGQSHFQFSNFNNPYSLWAF
jgi:hypothetical protein